MIRAVAEAVNQPASDLEIWLRFFGTLAGIFAASGATYVATRTKLGSLENKVDKNNEVAVKANQNALAATETVQQMAAPTSNGFADAVLRSLADLERGQVDVKSDLADVKLDLSEVRQDLKSHIGDHATADVRRKM